MKQKAKVSAKKLGIFLFNNMFYIIGFLCCFLPALILLCIEGAKYHPEGWGINIGFVIPLFMYVVIFFKFLKGRMRIKLGQWEAVHEIDEQKHIVGILTFTLLDYISYIIILVICYLVIDLITKLGENINTFFVWWILWFTLGIVFMFIDKIRHITKKGLKEYEEIEEEVEITRKGR